MDCQMGQKNAEMTFCVDVVGVFGKETVDLCDTEEQFQTVTVGQLKEKILNKLPFKDWPEDRELFFENKKLEGDNALLYENGVKHKSIIHMVLVYNQKEFVVKKDDEESEARTSADKEECCRQKEMEKIQVLLCVFGKPEKIMAVFCNTKEEMQKMTVWLLKRKIERNVRLDKLTERS